MLICSVFVDKNEDKYQNEKGADENGKKSRAENIGLNDAADRLVDALGFCAGVHLVCLKFYTIPQWQTMRIRPSRRSIKVVTKCLMRVRRSCRAGGECKFPSSPGWFTA